MKNLILLGLLLTSCAGSRPRAERSKYGDVLPIQRGLITYRTAVARTGFSSVAADTRTRSWIGSAGQVLTMIEQPPVKKKTDLVYLASLSARRVPTTNGDLTTLPPLRFSLTVDNQSDSSKIWVTNFEVAGKMGRWEPLETHRLSKDRQMSMMWLSDVDAMVSEMIDELSAILRKPVPGTY